ncbi:hypothetical protein QQ045_033189 [Rhodiola kirilowii]
MYEIKSNIHRIISKIRIVTEYTSISLTITARRKDARSLTIKKTKAVIKFKVRCSKYLYTLRVHGADKVEKLKRNLPPATMPTISEEDEVPPCRRPNLPRQRESRGQNLLEDYFIKHPIFPQQDFRRSCRMSSNLFNRIKTKLCNNDPFGINVMSLEC